LQLCAARTVESQAAAVVERARDLAREAHDVGGDADTAHAALREAKAAAPAPHFTQAIAADTEQLTVANLRREREGA
jgi:hypothetical protein